MKKYILLTNLNPMGKQKLNVNSDLTICEYISKCELKLILLNLSRFFL